MTRVAYKRFVQDNLHDCMLFDVSCHIFVKVKQMKKNCLAFLFFLRVLVIVRAAWLVHRGRTFLREADRKPTRFQANPTTFLDHTGAPTEGGRPLSNPLHWYD